jgi:hypothetical protein
MYLCKFKFMFSPSFLSIIDKFIITNVHDATQKCPQKKIPNFFPISLSWCMGIYIYIYIYIYIHKIIFLIKYF